MLSHKILCKVLILMAATMSEALPRKAFHGDTTIVSTNSKASTSNGANPGGAATAASTTTTATDGSTILAKTAVINGLSLQYKIAGPAAMFMPASGVTGAAGVANATGANGLNVLLHGDGGQSFIDFPNQAVQGNLMGVVVLAPNTERFWGGGSGLDRTDGVAHAAAVDKLIAEQLPLDMAFDPANVHFAAVSGGSLLMSGFFMPAFGAKYQTSTMLMCGGMAPQVAVVDAANLAKTRIHFQSTQSELTLLQPSIPQSIVAYEKIATDAGLSAAEVGTLQTADNTPVGGHCEFDGQGFVSGIQLMSNNYASVMQGGNGNVAGIGNVLKTVVGNEKLTFAAASTTSSTTSTSNGGGRGHRNKNN